MNNETREKILLFSDANFLSFFIVRELIQKKYFVEVVTDRPSEWKNEDLSIVENYFKVYPLRKYLEIKNYKNAIYVGGFIKKESYLENFKKFVNNPYLTSIKTLALFPLESTYILNKFKIRPAKNYGVIYVGDLLGPNINLQSNLYMSSLVSNMIKSRKLILSVGELFAPISVIDVARIIAVGINTQEFYNKETTLKGSYVSSQEFWKANFKFFTDLKVNYDINLPARKIINTENIKVIDSKLPELLSSTYLPIIRKLQPQKKSSKNSNNKNKQVKAEKQQKVKPYRVILLSLLVFILLSFPFLSTLFSGSLMYLSYKELLANKTDQAQKLAGLASFGFKLSKSESDLLAPIPVVGSVYKENSYITFVGINLCESYTSLISLVVNGEALFNGVFSNDSYDLATISSQLKNSLDYVYRQLSLVELQTQQQRKENNNTAGFVGRRVDFEKLKNLSSESAVLAANLVDLLGLKNNKNYLILFQNNMELRPTGGFIGSYGIADVGSGKLNGLSVNDIYSADGQLKGHVEPPLAIKNYLNEANWWFRDSNWDPDFNISAARAEWFLEKEMGQKVDGVIAIDLNPISDILNYTGPIFLPDYNLTVNKDNLYEKTQEESQANFFPGSRKKASFLTALSRVLLSEIGKLDTKKKAQVIKVIYDNLNERHIQIYLHNESIQSSIAKLGWDGTVQEYSCGDGCFSDFLGEIEANLGVNKANYFLTRKFNLNLTINKTSVSKKLTVGYKNNASSSLGLAGKYKTYVRFLLPLDSKNVSVHEINGQTDKIIIPDFNNKEKYLEAGLLLEVIPGGSKNLVITWDNEMDSNKFTNYGLFFRKQAGTQDDPLKVVFQPLNKPRGIEPQPNLTKDGVYTYNTNLSKDFFLISNFK